ncbi:MAG: cytochrome o ubiquinol oxidase subunit IV [Sphingomonas sp.]|uniref:cytochrome o ubiquinol oxidase subunit IV n=1 Tax=Sphingomonas sp. TaxID=28214 RepID=UPI001AC2C77B|nr:cytochrome o ubiquinol oxidase subunit IV [Sphingomonas sp.]MBN8808931.1 cytochrome o ubiquinol oxidase subunit IV [Sphingomonas sp.]
MSEDETGDTAPGDHESESPAKVIGGLTVGFVLASLLTVAAFVLPTTGLVYGPAIPVALIALAVGQMGVHLVFFLHITTGPDNTNNVLALALGVLIVGIVLIGSVWIMWHLNHNMMPPGMLERMQR